MKKLVAAVLSAAICFSTALMPSVSAAEITPPESSTSMKMKVYDHDLCGANAHWKLEGGTLTIYGSGDTLNWEGVAYTPWYERMSEIRNVVIEEGITSVGRASFLGASNLTSVILRHFRIRGFQAWISLRLVQLWAIRHSMAAISEIS